MGLIIMSTSTIMSTMSMFTRRCMDMSTMRGQLTHMSHMDMLVMHMATIMCMLISMMTASSPLQSASQACWTVTG